MFSALSDYCGYLSLLNFFLRSSYKNNYGQGKVSVLIHINVPAIRERKKGIVKHIIPHKLRKLPFN